MARFRAPLTRGAYCIHQENSGAPKRSRHGSLSCAERKREWPTSVEWNDSLVLICLLTARVPACAFSRPLRTLPLTCLAACSLPLTDGLSGRGGLPSHLLPPTSSLRKEVIQPQVLLRLPCYDFTPIMNHTLGRCLPCGLACGFLVQSTFVM